MKFSVVIPTHNRIHTLQATLNALCNQIGADYEVIVVDDGSVDDTRETVAREYSCVRYLAQPNRGPAAARNAGIRIAEGDVIAFTDDDCVPPRDWLARLADAYTRYPEVAGVGGSLRAPQAVLQREPLARYEAYIARSIYGANEYERVGGFDSPAGGTNNMSYNKRILAEVGGFDESFRFAAGEDADLKWRVCERGHRLLYVPVEMRHQQQYNWQRFRRQSFTRGRGRTRYEIARGRRLSRFLLLGRLARAWIVFPLNLVTMPEPAFAIARLVEQLWGVAGQWAELQES